MEPTELLAAVELAYTPIINFAMQQNHVPVVRHLLVTNNTDADWHNVRIDITAEPDFALPWGTRVEFPWVMDLVQVHEVVGRFEALRTERGL